MRVWLNGFVVDDDSACVSLSDGGWLYGAGLFETIRAERGRPFRYDRHLARLCASARELFLPMLDKSLPSAEEAASLMVQNNLSEARLRLTVSAGAMRESDVDSQEGSRLTVALTAAELVDYPDTLYDNGVTVIVSPYKQSTSDPLAGHKSACYLPRLLALRKAREARCMEAIWFTTENLLAEGSISNVFVVKEGVLQTPPVSTPVLPGIARGLIIEIARRAGVPVEERPLTINDLLDADEVFLTNSIMRVMPVVRVERKDIGEGKVGSISRKLFEAYRVVVAEECGLR